MLAKNSTMLKSAINSAKVGSWLTKISTLLKSAIKSAKVCSLKDDNLVISNMSMVVGLILLLNAIKRAVR